MQEELTFWRVTGKPAQRCPCTCIGIHDPAVISAKGRGIVSFQTQMRPCPTSILRACFAPLRPWKPARTTGLEELVKKLKMGKLKDPAVTSRERLRQHNRHV